MTQDEIRTKREEIEGRLRKHDAARLIIEAELNGLRHVCQHPRLRKWNSYDYGGGCDAHEQCDDCGYGRTR